MIIKFRYIGIPLENLKNETQTIEIEDNASIDKLLVKIAENYSNIDFELLRRCTFMVDNKKADRNTILSDNNTLLIMKVLGGG